MGLLLSGKNPAAYKTAERATFTAIAGQTTFTVPVGYNVGDIDVYLNGIRLIDADDYIAINGTTVVLNSAAAVGDSLVVVCYYNFLNSSSYTKAEGDARYVGFGSTTPMSTYLRTPNYGVSSYSDSASASLEANPGLGTQGVGIKASGRSMATTGGELTYISDTRGASGAHRFYGWNGTSLTTFGGFDSIGRHTIPQQPKFNVYTSSTAHTGGAWNKISSLPNIEYNVGGHWDSSSQRFNAPVTGSYVFFCGGWCNASGNGDRYAYSFRVNGAGLGFIGGGNYCLVDSPMAGYSKMLNLTAGDYVEIIMFSASSMTLGGSHTFNFGGYLFG